MVMNMLKKTRFIREYCEANPEEEVRFYACGGDGTLYEVVNACACHENAEVAAFPLGSGNDFIRIFGDKKDLRNVADHVNGTVMDFDLIKCGDQWLPHFLSKKTERRFLP